MRQDVYVAHYDKETNIIEIRNYESKELNKLTFNEFVEFVKNVDARIFINDVNIIAALIPGGKIDGVKKMNEESEEFIRYTVNNCMFESFSVKCPSDWSSEDIKSIYNTDTVTDGMIAHIEFMGGTKRVSKTLAAHSVKTFYADIKEELWQDKKANKNYISTVKEFNMLHAGCKKGCLSKPQTLKKYNNIAEWDIKTAYGAAFVCDDKFPIGTKRITRQLKVFIEELKKGHNVKFVCDSKIQEIEEAVNKYGISFWDDFNKMTSLEYYDIIDVKRLGVNFGEIFRKYDCTYITYDDTGYTHRAFAAKYVEVFEQKNQLKKGTPERAFVKAQTEHIYGKSIQKRVFANDAEVVRHYRGRGENYLTPQMGNHASACVRHQIFNAIFALGDDVIYFDTDGIKVKDNDKTKKYFEECNKIIAQKMANAGFEGTLLGSWEQEQFDEFIAIRSKIYVTRKDKTINITAAGMDDYSKQFSLAYFFNRINKKDIIKTIEQKGFPFMVKQILKRHDGQGVQVVYLEPFLLGGKEDFA